MPSNSQQVCVPCRYVARQTYTCPHCGEAMVYAGKKWRAPRKTNDKAWKRIAEGDWLWDKHAVEKKNYGPWTEEWRQQALERERTRNKKYRQGLYNRIHMMKLATKEAIRRDNRI